MGKVVKEQMLDDLNKLYARIWNSRENMRVLENPLFIEEATESLVILRDLRNKIDNLEDDFNNG